MGNPFGTSLPPLAPPDALQVDVRPASLKRWVASLEQLEFGESTRQLYERLVSTNRADLPPRARFEWLESLAVPLRSIAAQLRTHYQNHPFPLTGKAMTVAQLANALHGEMILAYRRILSSPPDTSMLGRGSDRQMRQVTCYRLFEHAGEILGNHQMMYTPVPHGLWRHLHSYYQRIRGQGWSDTPIPGVAAPATIEHLYRRMLLLALLPVQLVPVREWRKIMGKIDAWAALLSVRESRQRQAAGAVYCIRFELDAPLAGVVDQCCGACDNRIAGVLLDTAPLIAELEHHPDNFCEVPSATDQGWPAPETIQMLLRAWRIPEAQREPRIPVDLQLTMVSGLDNIHAILAAESVPPASSPPEKKSPAHQIRVPDLTLAETSSKPVLSAFPEGMFLGQREPDQDVWKLSYGEEKFVEPKPAWNEIPREKKVDELTARAVDASATGYRLEMTLPENSTLRLGELIAVRSINELEWELFLLRWVRRMEGERVTLGLERMGDGLRALDLVVQGSDATQAVLHAVSVLDEEMMPLLLMPTLPSLAKKRLAIRYGGEETAITLADKRALSPLFESYTYASNSATAERQAWAQAAAKPTARENVEEQFHELWTLL